jgi:hypothetical protein
MGTCPSIAANSLKSLALLPREQSLGVKAQSAEIKPLPKIALLIGFVGKVQRAC